MVTNKLDQVPSVRGVGAGGLPVGPPASKTSSLARIVDRHRHVAAARSHPSQAPVPADRRIVRTAAAKEIVVVDDDSDQVELTIMLLRAAGHSAHGTTDSSAGVALVVQHAAGLLLIDFMMPGMSGGDVGKALRAHPSSGSTKIMMISGTLEETVRAEFDRFDLFLQKPVHADRLLRSVEDL